jgi:hypothetical protein
VKLPWRRNRVSKDLAEAIQAREAAEQKLAQARPDMMTMREMRQVNHVGSTLRDLIAHRVRREAVKGG